MPRLNPRLRVSKKSDGRATTAFMAGIPRADFDLFMELVVEYGAHEYRHLVDAIIHARDVGPTGGVSLTGRNSTVTVTVKSPVNRHLIEGLFHLKTIASLALNRRLVAERGERKSYTIVNERSGPYARLYLIIKMLDDDADRERRETYYNEYVSMRSLTVCSKLEIKRRREAVVSGKKLRVGMAALFAENKSPQETLHDALGLILDCAD